MSEFYTSTSDTEVRERPYCGTGEVGQFVDFLAKKETDQKLREVNDPIERGILVGEAVRALLEDGEKPIRALIMQAEIDEHGKFEIDYTTGVNHGIGIGLRIGDRHLSANSVVEVLREASDGFFVEVTEIRSHEDYTVDEFEGMTTSRPELAVLFPVPEVALRFTVIGIPSN